MKNKNKGLTLIASGPDEAREGTFNKQGLVYKTASRNQRKKRSRRVMTTSAALRLYAQARDGPEAITLWSRVFRTGRYQVELGVQASAVIGLYEGDTAHIVLTEVNSLHDLGTAPLDLCGISVNDDVALGRRIVVQLDIEVVNTSLNLVILLSTKLIDCLRSDLLRYSSSLRRPRRAVAVRIRPTRPPLNPGFWPRRSTGVVSSRA